MLRRTAEIGQERPSAGADARCFLIPLGRNMNRIVEALPESELLATHPMAGIIPGWFFRVEETSNNAWRAEGKDKWGRLVSCQGSNDQEALHLCMAQAQDINASLASERRATPPA